MEDEMLIEIRDEQRSYRANLIGAYKVEIGIIYFGDGTNRKITGCTQHL
jgi:hypothetical protein